MAPDKKNWEEQNHLKVKGSHPRIWLNVNLNPSRRSTKMHKGKMTRKKKPVTKNRLLSDAERKVPKSKGKWSHQSSGGTGGNGGNGGGSSCGGM